MAFWIYLSLTTILISSGYGQLELDPSIFASFPFSAPSWVTNNGRNQTFWTSDTKRISSACWADVQTYLTDLAANERWALKMADSYGGRASGWNSGNVISEGHFDQCMAIKSGKMSANGKPLNGKHCITYWGHGSSLQSYVLLGAGVCVPTSCQSSDVFDIMRNIGPPDSYFPVPYPQEPLPTKHSYCHEHKHVTEDSSAIAAIAILSVIGLFAVIGTLYDIITYSKRHSAKTPASNGTVNPEISSIHNNYEAASTNSGNAMELVTSKQDADGDSTLVQRRGEQVVTSENGNVPVDDEIKKSQPQKYKPNTFEEIMLCFSVVENVPRMLSFDHPKGSYQCLNGIRFLSMCWITLGHSWVLGLTTTEAPIPENLPGIRSLSDTQFAVAIHNSSLAVETFFVLSALLTTISFMKQLRRNNDRPSCVHFGLYYFHRFWRLTPVYMLILMMWTVFFPYASGPLFPDGSTQWTNCRTEWWRHLLYIQNLGNTFERDCMGWTWYLANDFQFYVFAPVSICLLYWKRTAGIVVTVLFIVFGVLIMISLSVLSRVFHLIDFFYGWYVVPWCRCTTYFMGIFLGYLMFRTDCKTKISKVKLGFAWFGAAVAMLVSLFPFGGWYYLFYESFQRPLFGLGVFWVIWACVTGHAGFINSILSWRGWLPLSRLTYTGYLIHPILIYYNHYASRRQIYSNQWAMAYTYIATLVLTLILSFLASLLMEIPFLNLEKVMFKNVDITPHAKREKQAPTV